MNRQDSIATALWVGGIALLIFAICVGERQRTTSSEERTFGLGLCRVTNVTVVPNNTCECYDDDMCNKHEYLCLQLHGYYMYEVSSAQYQPSHPFVRGWSNITDDSKRDNCYVTFGDYNDYVCNTEDTMNYITWDTLNIDFPDIVFEYNGTSDRVTVNQSDDSLCYYSDVEDRVILHKNVDSRTAGPILLGFVAFILWRIGNFLLAKHPTEDTTGLKSIAICIEEWLRLILFIPHLIIWFILTVLLEFNGLPDYEKFNDEGGMSCCIPIFEKFGFEISHTVAPAPTTQTEPVVSPTNSVAPAPTTQTESEVSPTNSEESETMVEPEPNITPPAPPPQVPPAPVPPAPVDPPSAPPSINPRMEVEDSYQIPDYNPYDSTHNNSQIPDYNDYNYDYGSNEMFDAPPPSYDEVTRKENK